MDREPVPEARLADTPHGSAPESAGWFIANLDEARGVRSERFGGAALFESRERPFPDFGLNVRLLRPGQPASLYHRESAQEAFFVVSGECLAIVEEEERPLRAGDLFYAPPWTAHVLVGAGDGPSVVLMVGARKPDAELLYPVSAAAARHGASVERETSDPQEAYAGTSRPAPCRLEWPSPPVSGS